MAQKCRRRRRCRPESAYTRTYSTFLRGTRCDEELRLDIGAFASFQRLRQHRADVGPDFLPHLGRRSSERPRMLAADDRLVRVIVEIGELRPPIDPDRLPRGQHDSDRGLQALWPRRRRAEQRLVPSIIRNEPGELIRGDRSECGAPKTLFQMPIQECPPATLIRNRKPQSLGKVPWRFLALGAVRQRGSHHTTRSRGGPSCRTRQGARVGEVGGGRR